ncbi:hypothetical protein AB2N04_17240 [Nitratireductor sp. GISD-1A_MAKvit]|uniref:hypothetical protein n=1 Tax=Nitratireductor sp. GISD-1A_MAKvit TaxID=3234198 RepID=UPI0034667E9E
MVTAYPSFWVQGPACKGICDLHASRQRVQIATSLVELTHCFEKYFAIPTVRIEQGHEYRVGAVMRIGRVIGTGKTFSGGALCRLDLGTQTLDTQKLATVPRQL